MLNNGDVVKVLSETKYKNGEKQILFPIGTICRVVEVCDVKTEDGLERYYGICRYEIKEPHVSDIFYYLEDELEKGHLEWVKEN